MQKGHLLEFACQKCKAPVKFSVLDLNEENSTIACSGCGKKYALGETHLKRQLKKFDALCRQILDSEEILAHTSVGVDIGDRHVQIPYKLLLTRLNSQLDLQIGETPLSIIFRMEPLKDIS